MTLLLRMNFSFFKALDHKPAVETLVPTDSSLKYCIQTPPLQILTLKVDAPIPSLSFSFLFVLYSSLTETKAKNMDKKTRNPPDSDLPPPPSYDESSDQAYNPRYSPRLTEEAPAASDSSPTSQLYPSAHKQQPQQEQQHFYSGQPSNRSPRHHTIIITSASPSGGLDERTALLNGMVEYERQFPLAALFFIFGWYVIMEK